MAQDFNTRFDIGLPAVPNTVDRELHRELLVIYNSIKLLSSALEKRSSFPIVFQDTIELYQAISVSDSGGTPVAILAQHGVRECHGFASVAATAGKVGEITLIGYIDNPLFSSPAGSKVYVGATAGQFTSVSPGAGAQRVGYKLATTRLWVSPQLLP